MKALHKGIAFDGQSAITKSSRTLKSKIFNPIETEVKKINTPYFKPDNIRFTIQERVQQQNLKNQGLLTKPSTDHLKHAGRIVQDLLKKHQQTKQKLRKLKDEAQKKLEKECPFQPEKKKIQKYVVVGNVIKRNQVWLNQKRRKQIERKQSLLSEDLGQCTFSPTLISKKKSMAYLRSRSQSQSMNKTTPTFNKSPRFQTREISPKNSVLQPSKDLSNIRYESGKRAINTRISNMF